MKKEMPGAKTPWNAINQLLAPDECFAVQEEKQSYFLFAPKQVNKLSALLLRLQDQNIPFSFSRHFADQSVLVSNRALQSLAIGKSAVIEAGGGCENQQIQTELWKQGYELGWEEELPFHAKCRLADFWLKGYPSGLRLRSRSLQDRLIGLELATSSGRLLHLGHKHPSAQLGPALHQTFWGSQAEGICLTKLFFQGEFRPAERIQLSWKFDSLDDLWELFSLLKTKILSWERLDCILSGSPQEQQFLIAQLSGSKEEMAAFRQECPKIQEALPQYQLAALKRYLGQCGQAFLFSSLSKLRAAWQTSEYIWYHGLIDQGWLITKRSLSFEASERPRLDWEKKMAMAWV